MGIHACVMMVMVGRQEEARFITLVSNNKFPNNVFTIAQAALTAGNFQPIHLL